MTPAEAAFWVFLDTAKEARFSESDNAKIAGISRANWYNWISRKFKPYESRAERMKRATRLIRADLAEKILPAMTNAKRREIVAALVKKLDDGDAEGAPE